MSYGTPRPGDDAQLRAWRQRYAEESERSFNIRLPLALARRKRQNSEYKAIIRRIPPCQTKLRIM